MAGSRYVTEETLARRTRQWLAAIGQRPNRQRPLPSLERAALLVIDVQRYFADPESHAYLPALEAVLPRIGEIVASFRAAGRPVVLTRHGSATDGTTPMRRWWRDDLRRGEPRAELLEALEPHQASLVLDKEHYSAFHETELERWLAQRGCQVLVIAGVMTHLCCETTARDAFIRGFEPVLVADGCASASEELHLGALRGLAHGFAVVDEAAALLGALSQRSAEPEPDTSPLPERCELAIVGAGPAGLAAAIQSQRAGHAPLVIDHQRDGGALAATANLIENYPGFVGGLAGRELVARFAAQAAATGVSVSPAEVMSIRHADEGLELSVVDPSGVERQIGARAVILASGTSPRPLPALAQLAAELPESLAYRVDALDHVGGARLLIIGGGEAAFDQALAATRLGAASVALAVRGEARAMSLLTERAERAGVTTLTRCRVLGAAAEDGAVTVTLDHAGERRQLTVDAVLCCIGRGPRHPKLPAELARDQRGAPRVDALGRTSIAGLYLAGDVRRGHYRQVGIAVGDGLAAAMHAKRYLAGESWTADES